MAAVDHCGCNSVVVADNEPVAESVDDVMGSTKSWYYPWWEEENEACLARCPKAVQKSHTGVLHSSSTVTARRDDSRLTRLVQEVADVVDDVVVAVDSGSVEASVVDYVLAVAVVVHVIDQSIGVDASAVAGLDEAVVVPVAADDTVGREAAASVAVAHRVLLLSELEP